ncbi:MAG: C40 family peptidase [Ginsengibacter sp.]
MRINLFPFALSAFITSCASVDQENGIDYKPKDSIIAVTSTKNETVIDTVHNMPVAETLYPVEIAASIIPVDSLVSFAETLIGVPYKYGSTDPAQGFDCSGFITYVFNHFNIKVPRSSIDFTNVGEEIPVANSKKGDLILFTGTDSTEKFVGHMGIITVNASDSIKFIHSTSGKVYGVTITPLNAYYKGRFVKVIRLNK